MPAFWLNPNNWPDGAFRNRSTFNCSFPAGPAACVLTDSNSGLPVSNTVAKDISVFTTLVSYRSMIVTVQQHILQQQKKYPGARGNLSWLLSGITLATKMIESKIRRAGLLDVLGAAGATNVQGEAQQKLDVYANQALLHCLGMRDNVALLVSEENEEPITLDHVEGDGEYAIVFDPLDGSSNIDVNVNVGTIFSIFRRDLASNVDVLQPGLKQVAAGYVVYGPSTVLVYTTGNGVFGFTLDPAIGAYVLSHDNLRMPAQGSYYSVNEANIDSFPDSYQRYIAGLRSGVFGHKYSSRYIGSLVADFHRTILKGGVFLYPPTPTHPTGKLRLLYEANPLALIAEQAGGRALNGTRRILEIQPEGIHQRTPLVLGGAFEIEAFTNGSK
jgi:fructose-1,6-bisphosphatase I